jgi:hypothetical protein
MNFFFKGKRSIIYHHILKDEQEYSAEYNEECNHNNERLNINEIASKKNNQ